MSHTQHTHSIWGPNDEIISLEAQESRALDCSGQKIRHWAAWAHKIATQHRIRVRVVWVRVRLGGIISLSEFVDVVSSQLAMILVVARVTVVV